MKMIKQLLVLTSFGLLASTANATLIELGETGSAGNPADEALLICDAEAGIYCGLSYDWKFESFSDTGIGVMSGGSYGVDNYNTATTPATADLDWDLAATGYGLFAIAVKAGTSINWYGVSDDMRITGSDMTLLSVLGKDSISHITLFVKEFAGGDGDGDGDGDVSVPEPGTLGLLGLGLLGLGLRRRNKA